MPATRSRTLVPSVFALCLLVGPSLEASPRFHELSMQSGDFVLWAQEQACDGNSPAVLLHWEAAPDALGTYHVFRTDGNYVATIDASVAGNYHLVASGFEYFNSYEFYATAETLFGTAYSNTVRVHIINQHCLVGAQSTDSPGPFTIWHDPPKCIDGKPTLRLRWSTSPGATHYTIQRHVPSPNANRTVENLTGNEFVDDVGIIPGLQHIYILTAFNAAGSWQMNGAYYLSYFVPPDICGSASLPGPFSLSAGTPFCLDEEPTIPLTFTQSSGADDLYSIRLATPSGGDAGSRFSVSGSGPYQWNHTTGVTPGQFHRMFAVAKSSTDSSKLRFSNSEYVFAPAGVCSFPNRPADTTTHPAVGVAPDAAILRAGVRPNNSSTQMYFQWGETTAYGFTGPTIDVGDGPSYLHPGVQVVGFACDTTYHYRSVATNPFLTTFGFDSVFTTGPCHDCGPDHLVLDLLTIPDVQEHEACVSITVGPDTTVLAGGSLTLTAPKIIFTSGFSVESGASLRAGPLAVP